MGKVFFCSEPLIMLIESYKVQKLLEWNMAPRYCGEDVKKVQVGETDSLNPSKKDEIRFWYSHRILEMKHDVKIFSAISPMRQGRKVHVCEADGKSFLLAFNRCIVS